MSAPLLLTGHIVFEIAAGITLAGSTDHAYYPDMEECKDQGKQALPTASNAVDITISGIIIDGRGESWWPKPLDPRLRLIVFGHCKHIHMHDLTIQNSLMWPIVSYYSDDLTFRYRRELAPASQRNQAAASPLASMTSLLKHVAATGSRQAVVIVGLAESPIRNMELVDAHIAGRTGAVVQSANGVASNFTVHADEGENVHVGVGVISSSDISNQYFWVDRIALSRRETRRFKKSYARASPTQSRAYTP